MFAFFFIYLHFFLKRKLVKYVTDFAGIIHTYVENMWAPVLEHGSGSVMVFYCESEPVNLISWTALVCFIISSMIIEKPALIQAVKTNITLCFCLPPQK